MSVIYKVPAHDPPRTRPPESRVVGPVAVSLPSADEGMVKIFAGGISKPTKIFGVGGATYLLSNSFEGGTDETVITTGNSGEGAATITRPDDDVALAGWNTLGPEAWEQLDDVLPHDGNSTRVMAQTSADNGAILKVSLSNATDPQRSDAHIVRHTGLQFSGAGSASILVELRQGTTLIATVYNGALDEGTHTTRSYTLSAGEADAITDYTDLQLWFTPTLTSDAEIWYTHAEFEVPGIDSGDAFELVVGSPVFDSAFAAHGAMSARFPTNGVKYVQWSATGVTERWFRFYVYKTADPAVQDTGLFQLKNTAETIGQFAKLRPNGHVLLEAGSAVEGSVVTPNNAWFRLEFHLICHASTGELHCRVYTSPDSTTIDETVSVTGVNTDSDTKFLLFGQIAGFDEEDIWYDDVAVSNTGWIGPYGAGGVAIKPVKFFNGSVWELAG